MAASPKSKPNYCRLSFILATEAPKAVIFRRGPTAWMQLILWDTSSDIFTEGQWFKGKIYTERCDLSPDGSRMIYFAAKYYYRGMPEMKEAGYEPTWTAISKPPYFTALTLWNQIGTWGGGGYFLDNDTVCLNTMSFPKIHPKHQPPRWLNINLDNCKHTSPQIHRMEQNGWRQSGETPSHQVKSGIGVTYEPPLTFSRTSPNAQSHLRMLERGYSFKARYGSPRLIRYTIQRVADGKEFQISDTWADWDQRGRLVYAEKGKLFTAQINEDGVQPTLLADFNPNQPTEVPPSEWATKW
ncbi:MAG: hypothetical protein KF726_02835 [Anaerolineae bacterium]|nr:hypothetical protein [Anaerolineae bacterium]